MEVDGNLGQCLAHAGNVLEPVSNRLGGQHLYHLPEYRIAVAQDILDEAATLLYEAYGKQNIPMSVIVKKLGENHPNSVSYIRALDDFLKISEETYGEKAEDR